MEQALLDELLETALADYRPETSFDIRKIAFPKQLEFIEDPWRLKTLFCTRRAAKSYTGGLYLVQEALGLESCNCLYIGLTRLSAKGIIWKDVLKDINKKNDLGMLFNGSELTATTQNGSIIYVTGADADEEEMEKLLGKKYRLVIIDEAASFTVDLRRLIYGILKPATVDDGGSICLLGTSGNLTSGLFFDITTGKEQGWKLFEWSAFDNPHVAKQWQEELDDIRQNRPLFMETPLFKQWYLNEWVIDLEKLVYRFRHGLNEYSGDLPHYRGTESWQYVLGVDLGYDPDPSAFVVVAFHPHDTTLYVLDCFKQTEMDITDVAHKIKWYKKEYGIDRVVIDGANKQAVMEMQKRHDIGLTTADKTGKVDFIQIMNAEMIQGKIKLSPQCQELKDEYLNLIWNDKSLKREEHPNCANHLCFVAGTSVDTSNGPMPIEDIKVGDLVLTRQGYFPVKRCGLTSERVTRKIQFSNGAEIICTPDHPVWIQGRGFVRADALLYGWRCSMNDECLNTVTMKGLYLRERLSEGIQTALKAPIESISSLKEEELFIELNGSTIADQFLKDGTFTTKTGIPLTTLLRTWSVLAQKSIGKNTKKREAREADQKRIYSSSIGLGRLQLSGTDLKKAISGIKNTVKKLFHSSKQHVLGVERFIQNLIWQRTSLAVALGIVSQLKDVHPGSMTLKGNAPGVKSYSRQTNTDPKTHAVYVVRNTIGTTEKVYNLEVDQVHEYFANGVLVSNCDASLYSWRFCYQFLSSLPKEKPNLRDKSAFIAHTKKLMDESLEKQIQKQESEEAEQDSWALAGMDMDEDPLSYFVNKRKR